MDEERQKKVLAGKQKFAQLMKKKQAQDPNDRRKKRQKKNDAAADAQIPLNSSSDVDPSNSSLDSSFASNVEMSSCEVVLGNVESVANGNGNSTSILNSIAEVVNFSVSSLLSGETDSGQELEKTSFVGSHRLTVEELKLAFEKYDNKIEEYRAALEHRDKAIDQLTQRLKESIDQQKKQEAENTSQFESLTLDIETLKLQLQQASELLRNQKGKNGISAEELLQAKNQAISLQQICHQKEEAMTNLTKQIQQLKRDISEGEFVKSNMQQAIDRLNSCLYYERRDADALKSQHLAEFKRIQQTHSEDLKHLHEDSEHRYKQTVNELNGKLKQMQNELLSFKGIATELEMCKKKHSAEVEQLKQKYIDLEESARKMKENDENRIKYLEMKIESLIKAAYNETSEVQSDEQEQRSEQEDESPRNSLGSQGWSIDINLDDVSAEIQTLRDENEQLNLQLQHMEQSCAMPAPSTLEGDNEMFSSHFDEQRILEDLWKSKYEALLDEKLQLESELHQVHAQATVSEASNEPSRLSELLEKFEELTQAHDALKAQYAQLQEERKEQMAFNKNLNKLDFDNNEKYLNRLNMLENDKTELKRKVEEVLTRLEMTINEKQRVEKSLFALKIEKMPGVETECSDACVAVQDRIKLEKQVSLYDLQLSHEKEVQNVLSSKVVYLENKYMQGEQQINDLKQEVVALHSELSCALKKQADLMNELSDSRQKYSSIKFELEKELYVLRRKVENTVKDDDARVSAAVERYLNSIEEKIDEAAEKEEADSTCGMDEMLLIDPESDMISQSANTVLHSLTNDGAHIAEDRMVLLQQFKEMGASLQALLHKLNTVEPIQVKDQKHVVEDLVNLQSKHSEILLRLHKKEQKQHGFNIHDKRNVLEETLRRGKDLLREKLYEKDLIEEELVRQQVELEHCTCNQRHLQEMLAQKEAFEQDLLRQREILEGQLLDMEHRLKERELALQKEQLQLQMEMQQKDLLIRKWKYDLREKEVEYSNLHGHLKTEQNLIIATMRQQFQQEGFQRIEQMQNEIESYHSVVISQLKENLQSQFAVRESQLLEQYSLEVTKLNEQHKEQIALMQSQCKTLVNDDEKNYIHAENEGNVEQIKNALDNLRQSMDEAEQGSFDQIRGTIHQFCLKELEKLKEQTDVIVAKCLKEQKDHLELLHHSDLADLEAKLQHANNELIARLKEDVCKSKKDEINKIMQHWKLEMKRFQDDYNKNLGSLLGVQELSTKSIYTVFQHWVLHDFKISTMNLTQQWESKYLDQLAKVREEIEEKFRTYTVAKDDESKCEETASSSSPLTEQSFSHLESLLEEREKVVKRTEEIRQTVEEACDSDMKILKKHLQEEFDAIKIVQDEMKKDVESGQSSTVVELHKLKEDYELLNEKYEEIIKEDIVIKEYPIRKVVVSEDARKLQEQLEQKHAREMEELRIYFEKQCENIEKRCSEEVSSLKAALQSGADSGVPQNEDYILCEQHPRQPTLTHFCDLFTIDSVSVNELEEHYKKELSEKLQEYCEQLEISKKDLEYTHSMKIKDLEAKHEELLKREVDKVRTELGEAHSQQMEELLSKQEEMMVKLRNKYAQDLAKEVMQVRLQCNSELAEEIEKACQKVHDQLKQEHQRKLQELQDDLEARQQKELEIIHSRLQAEKSEEINTAIVELQRGLQQQRQELHNSMTSVPNESILDAVSDAVTRNAIDKAKFAEEVKQEVEIEIGEKYNLQITTLEEELLKTKCKLENILATKAENDDKQKQEAENLKLKLANLELEIKDAMTEHSIIVETLKEEFQEELSNKDLESEKQIKLIKADWEKSFQEQLDIKIKDLQNKHETYLEALKAQHLQELADERMRLQEELTSDHITKFEVVTSAIDNNHQQELETLKQTLLREREECISQLRHDLQIKEKEHKALLAELQENHERDIEELKHEHAKQMGAEVRRVKQEMESHNDEKLQALTLDAEMLKSEMKTLRRHEISELNEKLQQKYREEMDAELKKTIDEMETKYQKLQSKQQEEHGKELVLMKNELQEAFESQLSTMQKDLMDQKEKEMSSLKLLYEEQVSQVQHQRKAVTSWDLEKLMNEVVVEEGQGDHQNKEGSSMLQSLQEDIDALKAERDNLSRKNEHLKFLLTELLQSYFNVECMINEQLAVITSYEESATNSPSKKLSDRDELDVTAECNLEIQSASFHSEDENDMNFSKKIPDDILNELDDESNTKDFLYATSVNLQSAVKRLLNLLAMTVQQCHEAKVAQLELINAATSNGEEAAGLLSKNEELQNQLKIELKTKDQLALELHKAAGLIGGYESEKLKLEQLLQKENETHSKMIEQLQLAQDRIQELEMNAEDQKLHLEHQREIVADGLNDTEKLKNDVADPNHSSNSQGLLNENSKLYENNKELKQQNEKERQQMLTRVRSLEHVIEDEVSSNESLLAERARLIDDLHQKVDALEKQLKYNKHFIEEQTIEREQEREESQRQIDKLQYLIRDKERRQSTEGWLAHDMDLLNEQLQQRSSELAEEVAKKEELELQLQRLKDQLIDTKDIFKNLEKQLETKNNSIRNLNEEIQNLKNDLAETSHAQSELLSEIEVLRSASSSAELSHHVQILEEQLEAQSKELETLNSSQSLMQELRYQLHKMEEKVERKTKELESLQLSASSVSSPSSEDISLKDQLEMMKLRQSESGNEILNPLQDIRRLEDKLEALSKAEEAAVKKIRDLEMRLKKQKHLEEELLQDRDTLQEQVNGQLLQISSLQSRIEERRHNLDNTEALNKIAQLQEVVDRERDALEKKEKELEDLQEQVTQLKQLLVLRESEVASLTLQTTSKDSKNDNHLDAEKLQKENEQLKLDLKNLHKEFKSMKIPAFAQSLINEKNQEIDFLNKQLEEMKSSISFAADSEKIKELGDQLLLKENECEKLKSTLEANASEIEALHLIASEKEKLEADFEEKTLELKRFQDIADQRRREVDALRSVLKEKEELLEQVSALQTEQKNLIEYQHAAEMKISELTTSVDKKEKEVDELKKRIDLTAQNSVKKQSELQKEIERLQDHLNDKENSIEILRHQLDCTIESSRDMMADTSSGGLMKLFEEKPNMKFSVDSLHDNAEPSKITPLKPESQSIPHDGGDDTKILQRDYEKLQADLQKVKSAEEESKKMLDVVQASLNEITDEKSALHKKMTVLRGERQTLQKRLQDLELENDNLRNQLQTKLKYQQQTVLNEELATVKNDILTALESSLKSIQNQLFEHEKKAIPENENDMSRVMHELVQTRGDLQQLHQQMQNIKHIDKFSTHEHGEADKAKTQGNGQNAEKEISEIQVVLTQSENERLQDEIDHYEETVHHMQELLDLEKQNVEDIKSDYIEKIEKLHNDHAKELNKLQSQLQVKFSQTSSDSSSASDISQNRSKSSRPNMSENAQNFTSISEQDELTVPIPEKVQNLLKKVHKEGVEMLSLSELYFLRYHGNENSSKSILSSSDTLALQQAWENEKHQLMSEIMALKSLLSQATDATASLRTTGEATTELTNSLLQTVATVFQRERDIILAELRTHILSCDAKTPDEFQRLEHRLNEMEKNQTQVLEAVQGIFKNTKQANEVDNMMLMKERLQHHQEREKLLNQIRKLERDTHDIENHLKQQVDLLEYRIRQESMFKDELQSSLDFEKKRTLELTSQLSREKSVNADLEIALALTRTELIKCQTSLDKDQREIQNLKISLESERFRGVALNQALESEQANFNQLQEAVEAEKRRTKASYERQQQIIQELQQALQTSKEHQIEAATALERERINVANAYRELESVRNKINADSSKSARSKLKNSQPSYNDLNRIQDLSVALERERNQLKIVTSTLYQERSTAAEELERERAANFQLKRKLESLKDEKLNLNREVKEGKEHQTRLEGELKQCQKQLSSLKDQDMKNNEIREAEQQIEREQRRELQLLLERERHKQQEQKLENQKMQQQILLLEKQIHQLKEFEQRLIKDLKIEKEQETAFAGMTKWSSLPHSTSTMYGSCTMKLATSELVRQQLYCLLKKCQMELEMHISRVDSRDASFEYVLQGLLKEVESINLDHVPTGTAEEEIDLRQFAEQVLHQNAELIGFVSKLCEEKMELRKMHTRLEDKLLEIQHKKIPSEQALQRSLESIKETLSVERSAWAEEKASLQLALHRAEAKIAHYFSEMGSQNLHQSQESLVPKDSKAKQWQLKFLRAESYRKALIYQKKYLLILLGGFQDTEAATLASIARLGISAAAPTLESSNNYYLRRFRSCVRVCIAISRMKFLAKRWSRIHSPSPFGSTQELFSQTSHDFSWKKFHRIGTTPPVKDLPMETRGSEASSERSNSSARRNLNYLAVNAKPSSSQSLQRCFERMDSLQVHLGFNTPTITKN